MISWELEWNRGSLSISRPLLLFRLLGRLFILDPKSFANILRSIMNRRIALKSAALILDGSFLTPAYLKGSGNHSVRLSFEKKDTDDRAPSW